MVTLFLWVFVQHFELAICQNWKTWRLLRSILCREASLPENLKAFNVLRPLTTQFLKCLTIFIDYYLIESALVCHYGLLEGEFVMDPFDTTVF